MLLPPLGHVKSIYDFIFPPIALITTKLGRFIDHYALTLPYK